MKTTIKILSLLFIFLIISSCSTDNQLVENDIYTCPMQCEGDKTYSSPGHCPVCEMNLTQPVAKVLYDETDLLSENSIFNLTSKWQTQNKETITLKDLKGKPLVVVMIYTTCKAACPRLVADVRNIEKTLIAEDIKDVKYIFVSIDPETDTPEQLKAFAVENVMDDENHVFLHGSVDDVREFSNVLAVKYKEISPLDFSHSNIISVFNPGGELINQVEGLGMDQTATINAIKSITTH
ncbi:SCO family protein [Putridiphycobacter roseus]|uniref:SCO family protein n=1 Tax=Putridiphycobacter roseus TaxID=2219161 RepID=A0A2W1NG70_9FLAO|nr:SCO family protein [Putridiphycobacter roseus]PZE18093.1 SCO family protein [Putridiphycobacter roseus]